MLVYKDNIKDVARGTCGEVMEEPESRLYEFLSNREIKPYVARFELPNYLYRKSDKCHSADGDTGKHSFFRSISVISI